MLKTLNVADSVEKEVVRFGNGSIVYTPKKWIGKRVIVVLEEKPRDISDAVMEMLKPYLPNIEGVFLYGSFARGENAEGSDVDVLIISGKKFDLKGIRGFEFLVMAKEEFIARLKSEPMLFLYHIIREARPLLNEALLEELKGITVKPDFREFFSSTLSAFREVNGLLEAEKKENRKYLEANACIYSLILRLRGMLLIKCFAKRQEFSNEGLKKLLERHGFGEETIASFMETYRAVRDDNEGRGKILLGDALRLFEAAKIEFIKTEELAGK